MVSEGLAGAFRPWLDHGLAVGICAALDRGLGHSFQIAVGASAPEDHPGAFGIRKRTRFNVGSVTKIVTAWLSLQLMERKEFRPDDPVRRFIPEYPFADTTVRHLVTHTAGYGRKSFPMPKREEYTAYLKGIYGLNRRDNSAGKRSDYFSPGYAVVTDMLQRIAGCGLEDLARESLFGPLGMNDTTFLMECLPEGEYTLPGEPDSLVVTDRYADLAVTGESGLYSTAGDLLKLGRCLLDDGSSNGRTLLSAQSRRMLLTDQTGGRFSRTWGLYLNDQPGNHGCFGTWHSISTVGHPGFSGCMWAADPTTDTCAVILTNSQLIHRSMANYRALLDTLWAVIGE